MKRMMTIVALMCAVAFQVNAQTTNAEKLQKEIEQKVKLANKHPKDGKMQLNVAYAILADSLSESRDFDRALIYANRALTIAQEHPAPKDTLLALSYQTLGFIYMGKQDFEKCMDAYEKSLDAFEVELGRLDPVTNANKIIYGWSLMAMQPSRGFTKIQEAFNDNARAPEDKRIENIDEAKIGLEIGLEMLLTEQAENFRYALPTLYIDGKKNYIVQASYWNMENPLVGWLVPRTKYSDGEQETEEDDDDDSIIFGVEDGQFTILPEEKRDLTCHFGYTRSDQHKLDVNEGEPRIQYFSPEDYNDLLTKFREFKANKGK